MGDHGQAKKEIPTMDDDERKRAEELISKIEEMRPDMKGKLTPEGLKAAHTERPDDFVKAMARVLAFEFIPFLLDPSKADEEQLRHVYYSLGSGFAMAMYSSVVASVKEAHAEDALEDALVGALVRYSTISGKAKIFTTPQRDIGVVGIFDDADTLIDGLLKSGMCKESLQEIGHKIIRGTSSHDEDTIH